MAEPGHDTRRHPCCAPWFANRGPDFTQRFRVEFLGALHGYADEFATLHEHLHGLDPGGPNGAVDATGTLQPVPHPGTTATNVHAQSQRAFNARAKKLFSLIWQHVEDPDLRVELSAIQPADGVTAWRLVSSRGELPATGLTVVSEEVAWASLRGAYDDGLRVDAAPGWALHLHRAPRRRATHAPRVD